MRCVVLLERVTRLGWRSFLCKKSRVRCRSDLARHPDTGNDCVTVALVGMQVKPPASRAFFPGTRRENRHHLSWSGRKGAGGDAQQQKSGFSSLVRLFQSRGSIKKEGSIKAS
jgi:hypothetical protein